MSPVGVRRHTSAPRGGWSSNRLARRPGCVQHAADVRDGRDTAGVSRWTTKYTGQQREAIVHAVLAGGLSIAEAPRRAVAGELSGVPAFTLPCSSAVEIVKQGRSSFEAKALLDPDYA